MRRRIASIGDSLTQGTGINGTASTYEQGGRGSWWERSRDLVANIYGVGPLLSPGRRLTSLGYVGNNTTEWTFSGPHTAVTPSDAFDKVPYGGSGIQGFRWGNGITVVDTWTKQKWMPPLLAIEVDIIDIAGGGEIQYRIDDGTWTSINQGANLLGNNTWLRFRINTPITSTIDFRAYNGTTGVNMLIVAVEPLFSLATDGFIWDNLAINGSKLHEMFTATAGDRMAWCDSVRLGTGGPASPHPNAGVTTGNINDVLLASSSGYGTDLASCNTRVGPLGPFGIISPWACDAGVYNATQQANYRAQAKTSAAGFTTPAKVLDLFDQFDALGYVVTQNAKLIDAGFLISDGIHESSSGHLVLTPWLYWFVRNQILGIGSAPTSYPVSAKKAAVQYSAKLAAVQYAAGAPIAI